MRRCDFGIRRYRDHNRPRWQYVVTHREGGKRKLKLFEKKAQAQDWAKFKKAEAEAQGMEHAEFATDLRVMAQSALEQLKPFGKTITDAVAHYVAYLKASERSCSAAQLVKEMIAAKKRDGFSERHVNDLRSRLKIFTAKFDGQQVATITSAEIDDWLRSLPVAPVTRNHYRSVTVLAFNFAIERGYAGSNPALKTAKAKETDSLPGILSVTQTTALLEAATPELLAYVAIGAFAGLRRAEIQRLDWKDVHFDADLIEVTAQKSKTARRRFVKIQPNLRAWLAPVRQHKGNVTPDNFVKQFEALRQSAGITDWPDNALRHSFASYHLAHFQDAAALALEMGHMDSGMIFSHYRQLVKPKEAARYWNIFPTPVSKVVPMTSRSR
jgi:integrase